MTITRRKVIAATAALLAADPVFVAARAVVLEFLHAQHANPALAAA